MWRRAVGPLLLLSIFHHSSIVALPVLVDLNKENITLFKEDNNKTKEDLDSFNWSKFLEDAKNKLGIADLAELTKVLKAFLAEPYESTPTPGVPFRTISFRPVFITKMKGSSLLSPSSTNRSTRRPALKNNTDEFDQFIGEWSWKFDRIKTDLGFWFYAFAAALLFAFLLNAVYCCAMCCCPRPAGNTPDVHRCASRSSKPPKNKPILLVNTVEQPLISQQQPNFRRATIPKPTSSKEDTVIMIDDLYGKPTARTTSLKQLNTMTQHPNETRSISRTSTFKPSASHSAGNSSSA